MNARTFWAAVLLVCAAFALAAAVDADAQGRERPYWQSD